MVRYLRSSLLFILILGVHAQSQQFEENQDQMRSTVFRVNVNLVQVDAVVTDSKGRPVDDLTVDDFIVLQDGKPQKITSFSMIRMREPAVNSTVVPMEPKQQDKDVVPPPPPPVKLKKENVRRTIALVVDDLGLSFESSNSVRRSLREWVDTEMQPGDLVAVILTGSGMGSLQQFTTDQSVLHAAIDRIVFNGLSRTGASTFAPLGSSSGLSSDLDEERAMAYTLGTLGSIKYVVNGLKSIPGRKSLILFSESMGLLRGRVTYGEDGFINSTGYNGAREIAVRAHVQRLIDDANRAAVVIHAIDPRGVVYTGLTAQDSLSGLSDAEEIGNVLGSVSAERTLDLITSQDGMVQLTQMTGGVFEHSRNDIENALQEVADAGEIYYLLGYQPDEKTITRMKEGKRQFHSIKVQVKRRDLRVRSRSGFFGSTDPPHVPLTRREHIEEALVSPFASGTLPVRLTALFSQTREKDLCINALLHFETNRLMFRDEDGWKRAEVDIVATTFNAKGEQIDLEHKTWSIQAKGETYEEMQKYGVVFLMRIPVKDAGPYQMRAVVSDTGSDELGSASQFIEVPNVDKGRLALSGIALSAKAMQLGAVGDQQEGMVADREVNGTVAVRVFKPGDRIAWAYQILNAKAGKDHKSQLQTYVRLFHDGREVYAADMKSLTLEMQEDSNRMIGTGRMELQKITPGDYTLQVIVRDMLAKEKHRTAVQSINFEIWNPKLSLNDGRIIPRR